MGLTLRCLHGTYENFLRVYTQKRHLGTFLRVYIELTLRTQSSNISCVLSLCRNESPSSFNFDPSRCVSQLLPSTSSTRRRYVVSCLGNENIYNSSFLIKVQVTKFNFFQSKFRFPNSIFSIKVQVSKFNF